MKTLKELEEIFSIFKKNQEQMTTYMVCKNWEIVIFKPFIRDNQVNYPFRIYGEVIGSQYPKINANLQWCGGVNYYSNTLTNQVTREEYEHELHRILKKHINFKEIAETI